MILLTALVECNNCKEIKSFSISKGIYDIWDVVLWAVQLCKLEEPRPLCTQL